MKPNLFKYATHELTQDAILKYLLCYSDEKNGKHNSELKYLSKNFLALISANYVKETDVITNMFIHKNQTLNMDIICELVINGKKGVLIIENKKGTIAREGQLSRYIEAINREYNKKEIKIFSYIQTEYENPENFEEYNRLGFSVITKEDLILLFEKTIVNINDDIVNQYFLYLKNEYYVNKENLLNCIYKKTFSYKKANNSLSNGGWYPCEDEGKGQFFWRISDKTFFLMYQKLSEIKSETFYDINENLKKIIFIDGYKKANQMNQIKNDDRYFHYKLGKISLRKYWDQEDEVFDCWKILSVINEIENTYANIYDKEI